MPDIEIERGGLASGIRVKWRQEENKKKSWFSYVHCALGTQIICEIIDLLYRKYMSAHLFELSFQIPK